MIASKYAVAFIQVAVVFVTALSASITDNVLSLVEALQVGGILLGSVVTVFLPLLSSGYAGLLKVLGAVGGAVITAVIPIVDTLNGGPGWTTSSIIIVVLAALNALATHVGVDVRIDAAKEALADTSTANAVPEAVDPTAVTVAYNRG